MVARALWVVSKVLLCGCLGILGDCQGVAITGHIKIDWTIHHFR